MKKKYLFISIICSVLSTILILGAVWLPAQYRVPVLMYHAVAPSWHEPLNNVSPGSFDRQMAYLKERGYHAVSLGSFVAGIEQGLEPDRRSVVITFDDGYANNYTQAYSLLRKYDIPATIFVEVGNLDKPGRLTTAQVREMAVNGISFGSHTVTGAYLPDVTHDERVREITESRRMLEEALDAPVEFIAYPVGGFSNDVKEIVRAAGYRAACATNRGHDRTGKDLYEIKRIRVKDTDAGLKLWIKLSGYYNLIRRTKEPF